MDRSMADVDRPCLSEAAGRARIGARSASDLMAVIADHRSECVGAYPARASPGTGPFRIGSSIAPEAFDLTCQHASHERHVETASTMLSGINLVTDDRGRRNGYSESLATQDPNPQPATTTQLSQVRSLRPRLRPQLKHRDYIIAIGRGRMSAAIITRINRTTVHRSQSVILAIGLSACSGDSGSPTSPSATLSGGGTPFCGTAHARGRSRDRPSQRTSLSTRSVRGPRHCRQSSCQRSGRRRLHRGWRVWNVRVERGP